MNEAWRAQQVRQTESNLTSAALSPTAGEPIPLNYLPFTPHLVLHLHPAELWQPDGLFPALEKLPGSPVSWLRQQIRHVTTFAPEDIAELTLTLNFGPRTTDPDVAAVIRLVQPRPMTELQRQLGKLRHDVTEAEIREAGSLCYLMIDPGTFVAASSSAAEALVAARDYPPLPPANLEALLAESDRTRHLTLLTDLKTIDVHREFILGQSLLKVSDQLITGMGSESETVLWSFHLRPNFFMETLVHPTTDSSAQRIRRTLQLQLNQLPERMLTATRQMQPATTGSRQLVGRFPAMLRALTRATSVDVHPQYVRMISLLPASAAGNLAAASLLTWQETISRPIGPSGPAETAPALPGTIAQRMSLPVLVDFRNLPLQEAMNYLGECIGTEVVIDGDALKSAGFTQNMAQTFDLGQVPARQAFGVILQRYAAERDPLVISLDERGKKILLTTRSAAADSRLVIFDTQPLNP